MCSISKLIVDSICLHKAETGNVSQRMEVEGITRGLHYLLQKGLNIVSLTTDRSKATITLMAQQFQKITHYFDAWHLIKSFSKKIREECKKVRGRPLQIWNQDLINHLWWAITSAKGDGKLCQEYTLSSIFHVIGVHEWSADSAINLFKKHKIPTKCLKGTIIQNFRFEKHLRCCHDPIVRQSAADHPSLDPKSKTFEVLLDALTSDAFLTDVAHVSPFLATSALEGFHGLVSRKYRSKDVWYDLQHFIARTQLATLHHNHNILDEMEGKRKVIGQKKQRAKHRGGDIVLKNTKTPPDLSWKRNIIDAVLEDFKYPEIAFAHLENIDSIHLDMDDYNNLDTDDPVSFDSHLNMQALGWDSEHEDSDNEEPLD
jgi:hypothetical protein